MLARDHIEVEALLDYAEGRVDARAAARVAAHLAACARCAADVAFWRRALATLTADRAPAPPEALVAGAIRLFDRAALPSPLQRLIAVLAFDSRLQPALAGARDAGEVSFKLFYEAGGTGIDLLCEGGAERWQITGQVLAPGERQDGWRISALGPAGEARAQADPNGEFVLRSLPVGVYELTVRDLKCEIVVRGLDLPGL